MPINYSVCPRFMHFNHISNKINVSRIITYRINSLYQWQSYIFRSYYIKGNHILERTFQFCLQFLKNDINSKVAFIIERRIDPFAVSAVLLFCRHQLF